MRVLHVLTRAYRRGAETLGVALHDELLRRGVESRVVALVPAPPRHDAFAVPTLGTRTRGLHTLLALRGAARSADVVVAHGSDTLLACRLALLNTDVPFVYVNIGDPLHWAGSPTRRARVTWMLRGAAAVAAISPTAADRVVEHLGVPQKKVRFTGNGRRAADFSPASADKRTWARLDLGLPEHAKVAVVVAALGPEKRVDTAIDAVASLPGWHLLIVGDGSLAPSLQRRARETAQGRIHFTGSVGDVRPALAAADVALLTSETEGLPGSLVEAAMAGLPLVATDVGFVRDIVRDRRTGRLVPVGSPAAVAAALVEAADNALEWGRQGRLDSERTYDLDVVVQRWTTLLAAVTQAPDR